MLWSHQEAPENCAKPKTGKDVGFKVKLDFFLLVVKSSKLCVLKKNLSPPKTVLHDSHIELLERLDGHKKLPVKSPVQRRTVFEIVFDKSQVVFEV